MVPPDWMSRLGTELGGAVDLLSASVETIGAHLVGQVVLGLPDTLETRVEGLVGQWGLGATRVRHGHVTPLQPAVLEKAS
jgi:hypothetical protein